MMSDLEDLRLALLRFRDERDWKQFHSLRNLIVSLNLEASELLELTQWRNEDEASDFLQSGPGRSALGDECADVLLYLILIADAAGMDLLAVARQKLAKNTLKYPVSKSRGSRLKYDRLE